MLFLLRKPPPENLHGKTVRFVFILMYDFNMINKCINLVEFHPNIQNTYQKKMNIQEIIKKTYYQFSLLSNPLIVISILYHRIFFLRYIRFKSYLLLFPIPIDIIRNAVTIFQNFKSFILLASLKFNVFCIKFF